MKASLKDSGLTKVSMNYVDTSGNMAVMVRIIPMEEIQKIVSFIDEKAVA